MFKPTSSGHGELPASILRSIGDKAYDKRKHAALEVEQLVQTLASHQNTDKIFELVDTLNHDFAMSSSQNNNARKGGLLCLAAVAVALNGTPMSQSPEFLERVVPPIVNACTETDSKMRYYALESLYNLAKSTSPAILSWLPSIFDILHRLSADPDASVQNASAFLSELIKDICIAQPDATIPHLDAFLPELIACLNAIDATPKRRQFLLGYIALLDSLPQAEQHLLDAIPQLLPSLLLFLSDSAPEVRQSADSVLADFLGDIATAPQRTDVDRIAAVLTRGLLASNEIHPHTQHQQQHDTSSSPAKNIVTKNAHVVATSLRWLQTLVTSSSSDQLRNQVPSILRSCLQCLDTTDPGIQNLALQLNEKLIARKELYMTSAGDAAALLDAAAEGVGALQETAKLESLRWTAALLQQNESAAVQLKPTVLIDALQSTSEKVVQEAAAVLAALSTADKEGFALSCILDSFRDASGLMLLQRRGTVILEKLCCELGAERVLTVFASLLTTETDADFARTIAQTLMLMLLTSHEFQQSRRMLSSAYTNPKGAEFFEKLFFGFSRSVSAALALSLLCQAYSISSQLVNALAEPRLLGDISANLIELTQLVSLLESPAFAPLRLHMLDISSYPALHATLYALLMILPQGDAFRLLYRRLKCIPGSQNKTLSMVTSGAVGSSSSSGGGGESEKKWKLTSGGKESVNTTTTTMIHSEKALVDAFITMQLKRHTTS